ncbi:MAG: hypothetical protein ACRC1K_06245, partial [Planctomycetia bacterium]
MYRTATWTARLAIPLLAAAGADLRAADAPPVSYFKQIRPIFQRNCEGCHQPAKSEGGYVMSTHADL